MNDFLKLDENLKTIIKKLNGICLLLIQNSIYQKEALISDITSIFDEKELVKINSKDFSLKTFENFQINLFEVSILSPVKIFIMEDINLLKTDVEKKLCEFLKDIPESTIVVLTASSLPKTNIFYKYHLKNKTLIDNLTFEEKEILEWINKELTNIKLTKYAKDLPSLILEAGNKNIDKIREILDYLEIYIKDNSISNKEFLLLFPIENQISDFKILDPIYSADFLEYERTLKKILKNKNQFLLISIFLSSFSQLLEIKSYQLQKFSSQAIAEKTKMQDWLIRKNLMIASKYSFSQLKNNLSQILIAEVKLKDINLNVISIFEDLFYALTPEQLLIRKK